MAGIRQVSDAPRRNRAMQDGIGDEGELIEQSYTPAHIFLWRAWSVFCENDDVHRHPHQAGLSSSHYQTVAAIKQRRLCHRGIASKICGCTDSRLELNGSIRPLIFLSFFDHKVFNDVLLQIHKPQKWGAFSLFVPVCLIVQRWHNQTVCSAQFSISLVRLRVSTITSSCNLNGRRTLKSLCSFSSRRWVPAALGFTCKREGQWRETHTVLKYI